MGRAILHGPRSRRRGFKGVHLRTANASAAPESATCALKVNSSRRALGCFRRKRLPNRPNRSLTSDDCKKDHTEQDPGFPSSHAFGPGKFEIELCMVLQFFKLDRFAVDRKINIGEKLGLLGVTLTVDPAFRRPFGSTNRSSCPRAQ